GPKTAAGKKRASMNAWKHGTSSALEAELRRLLRLNALMLRAVNASLRNNTSVIAGNEVTRQSIFRPATQTPQDGLPRSARNDGRESCPSAPSCHPERSEGSPPSPHRQDTPHRNNTEI